MAEIVLVKIQVPSPIFKEKTIYIMTVRKSLPYQGSARRAIGSDNTPPTYDTEIDVSAVSLKDGERDDSDLKVEIFKAIGKIESSLHQIYDTIGDYHPKVQEDVFNQLNLLTANADAILENIKNG